MPPCAAMNAPAMSSSSPVVMPGCEVLADVRDRRGDEVAGAGDALDLLGSLADDHGRSASSISAKTSSTLPPASIVRSVPAAR